VYHPEYSGKSNEVPARVLGIDLKYVLKYLVVKVVGTGTYVICVVPSDHRSSTRKLANTLSISRRD